MHTNVDYACYTLVWYSRLSTFITYHSSYMQTFSSHIQYLTLIQSLIMIQLYMYGQSKLNVLKLAFAYENCGLYL